MQWIAEYRKVSNIFLFPYILIMPLEFIYKYIHSDISYFLNIDWRLNFQLKLRILSIAVSSKYTYTILFYSCTSFLYEYINVIYSLIIKI